MRFDSSRKLVEYAQPGDGAKVPVVGEHRTIRLDGARGDYRVRDRDSEAGTVGLPQDFFGGLPNIVERGDVEQAAHVICQRSSRLGGAHAAQDERGRDSGLGRLATDTDTFAADIPLASLHVVRVT